MRLDSIFRMVLMNHTRLPWWAYGRLLLGKAQPWRSFRICKDLEFGWDCYLKKESS